MSKLALGILGGGQLGSMLAQAAKKINIKTIIYCDDKDAPARELSDEFIYGNYEDKKNLEKFIEKVDIITFEFENIPFETLDYLSKFKKVYPNPTVNKTLQNRLFEKNFVNKLGIKTTNYVSINNAEEIIKNKSLLPGLLKTTTLGYDGKGQYKINKTDEINNLKINFSNKYILEKFINLKKEISVVLTRYHGNKFEIYEPIENEHKDQILKHSKIPAVVDDNIMEKSKEWAKNIATELDYIGTMCVEFFIDDNNELYVNEIAPRVHNSGHLTINAFNISQFENHIRAVCNLERISLKKISNAQMINILGDEIIEYRKKKFNNNEFFFDYMKKKIKLKRKMGHLTILKN